MNPREGWKVNPEVMLGLLKEPERENDGRWSQTEAHLQTAVIYAGWGYRTVTTEDVKRDRKD